MLPGARKAFSLIEILISISILCGLFIVFYSVVSRAHRTAAVIRDQNIAIFACESLLANPEIFYGQEKQTNQEEVQNHALLLIPALKNLSSLHMQFQTNEVEKGLIAIQVRLTWLTGGVSESFELEKMFLKEKFSEDIHG